MTKSVTAVQRRLAAENDTAADSLAAGEFDGLAYAYLWFARRHPNSPAARSDEETLRPKGTIR